MKGQLLYYRSKLDEVMQPLPVCATDDGSGAKPLILDLSPGAISNLAGSVSGCEQMAGWLREDGNSCVFAKPCGRGPGSVYQGPAEVDLFEAIDALCEVFSIDRNRISVLGGSMGGASTWFHASHYPDRFAAAAPFCGYCDYRLWKKPGGFLMRTHPWEEFSWESRGAAYRVENMSNMGLWITHGEWDIGIGGGVPVEHSRRMSNALTKLGIEHTYNEVPKCGHGCMMEKALRPVLNWLCRQKRTANPERVRLTVHGLRHHRSHWVAVDQLERYGRKASVDAAIVSKERLEVNTKNVRRLSLGPVRGRKAVTVRLDGQSFRQIDISGHPVSFERRNGKWKRSRASLLASVEKRHGCSGPIGDIFFDPLRLVKSTHGSEHENFLSNWMAGGLPGHFKSKNGGVHRGIFDGESFYDIQLVDDSKLSGNEIESCNLILLGTFESNSALSQFKGKIPLEFGNKEIRLGRKRFKGKNLGLSACFPSPENPERMLVVTGGNTPKAITEATHLNLQLLPDYLVWDGPELLEYGFFGNGWE